jgi:hypothetical protein
MSKPRIRKYGQILAVTFFDRMIDRQTRALSDMVRELAARENGRLRLVLEIDTRMPAAGPEQLLESLHFTRLNQDWIERIAVVGTRAWEETTVGLFGLFGGVQIEFFDRSRAAEAIRWLQEPS